ncbi:MAG: RagB/SusD family nutrient uptake outer membrane protein [Gemmatimonadetes bacterium]|nr:RagB/SusD family nutrient uptake outer membrane protein [Gemmatimonadota bacterium]MCC7134088.1 RagB/SusD family nutrient uptake outer membrane protein [Gemmatimonadales bacterium]
MSNSTSPRGWARGTGAVIALVGSLSVASCSLDDLLEVELPGRVLESALDDPALAETLVRSVVSDFDCAWNNWVVVTALLSDQYMEATGNLALRNFGSRRVEASDANLTGTCRAPLAAYTPMQIARYQGEDIFRRLDALPDAGFPNKTLWKATVRAYTGYSLVALGEAFCGMVIDKGPLLQRADVLAIAESRFTDAINLATQANTADILNMARVGRARVRLDLGNFAGARTDAEQVPAAYVKNATRDATDTRRYNSMCEVMNCAQPPRRDATIAPSYRNVQWAGVPDPRLGVATRNEAASDAATIHWFHQKANSRATPVVIASGKEAQLIVAEAAARSGDLATARTIINARHTAAGIPGYDASGTASQADVTRQVIEERRRELFAEAGHRFNDHLRFRGTPFQIPFLGEPGSDHPTGVNHKNVPYGPTTCIPLPSIEVPASAVAGR